jgi:tRNA wybutosine-synthesizing protein 2
MGFKEILIEKLKEKLNETEISLIPKGFQKTGNIIIINLPEELESKFSLIGKNVLEMFPNIKTVCTKIGEITGKFRKPQIKIIAGENNLEVENFENGVWFCYDAGKIMFAKGNVSERGRLPKIVKNGEVIVDMFVGIGYFSLPIAKKIKNVKIYGIDLNEDSIYWLKKAVKKNKLSNIEIIHEDSKEEIEKLIEKGIMADRVLMGYLPPPEEFIPSAMKILKKGGMIHYDALIRTDHIEEDLENIKKLFEATGRKVKIINPQKVKSYRPKVDHYVIDFQIN